MGKLRYILLSEEENASYRGTASVRQRFLNVRIWRDLLLREKEAFFSVNVNET